MGGRMSKCAFLILPFPPKELSPNKRLHWAQLSNAKKSYRAQCYYLARHLHGFYEKDAKLGISLIFFPPDKRHRDDDNMEAAFKAGRDGVAEALGVNDRFFSVTRKVSHETLNKVEMFIEELV